MKLIGFRDFDFASGGYWAGLEDGDSGLPSITPTVLPRAGAFPTFGPLEVGELVITARFGYQGALSFEAAFQLLYRRLDVFNRVPGQLRAQLLDGTNLATNALVRVQGFSSFAAEDDVNVRTVEFISVEGWKTLTTQTTGAVTF